MSDILPAPPKLPRTTVLGPISVLFVGAVILTHGWLRWTVLAIQIVLLVVQVVCFVRYSRASRKWRRTIGLTS